MDGNVTRLLCRLLALREDPRDPGARNRLQGVADRLLPKGHSADFNQAMMELGALVCRPGRPRCPECPLAEHCEALRRNEALDLPLRKPKPQAPLRVTLVLAVFHGGRLLIRRRAPEGLLGGLWELPGVPAEVGCLGKDGSGTAGLRKLRESLRGVALLERVPRKSVLSVRHTYTHFREELEVFPCRGRPAPGGRSRPEGGELCYRWTDQNDLHEFPITGATRKILELLEPERG